MEAPASLADGFAAIARELRAMADAEASAAGVAAIMHAAILALLASILFRLEAMFLDWQQRRASQPRLSRYRRSTRPDSLPRLARLASRIARRRESARPAARLPATVLPAAPPRARPTPRPAQTHHPVSRPAHLPVLRRPAPPAFSKPAWAFAPSHAAFVTIS